jgi:hypothetical protein
MNIYLALLDGLLVLLFFSRAFTAHCVEESNKTWKTNFILVPFSVAKRRPEEDRSIKICADYLPLSFATASGHLPNSRQGVRSPQWKGVWVDSCPLNCHTPRSHRKTGTGIGWAV